MNDIFREFININYQFCYVNVTKGLSELQQHHLNPLSEPIELLLTPPHAESGKGIELPSTVP